MKTFIVIVDCEYPDGLINRTRAHAKHAEDVRKKLSEVPSLTTPICTPICASIGLVGTMIQYTVN